MGSILQYIKEDGREITYIAVSLRGAVRESSRFAVQCPVPFNSAPAIPQQKPIPTGSSHCKVYI